MRKISKSYAIITLTSLSIVLLLALMIPSIIGKENRLVVAQEHITALRSMSSGFRELVISLRHGVTYNYDTANNLEQSIADHQMHLAKIVEDIPELNKHLKPYLQSASQRNENWEQFKFHRCQPRRATRRLVVPGSREARL